MIPQSAKLFFNNYIMKVVINGEKVLINGLQINTSEIIEI